MALEKVLEESLNDQIQLEFASVYAYLQMSAWFQQRNLPGFSRWMHLQAEEEWTHAMKFNDFVMDRGGEVRLQPIEAPKADFGAPLEVFEYALAHERKVTQAIHALYRLADEHDDYASLPLLQWFVSEQVEEEATVEEIVEHIRMVADDPTGLLMLDRQLGARDSESVD